MSKFYLSDDNGNKVELDKPSLLCYKNGEKLPVKEFICELFDDLMMNNDDEVTKKMCIVTKGQRDYIIDARYDDDEITEIMNNCRISRVKEVIVFKDYKSFSKFFEKEPL